MSLMDKIRSFFSGGSADSHAGHDHSAADHEHPTEPVSPTAPTVPTDPPGSASGDEDRSA
jgi:hypothetical protein